MRRRSAGLILVAAGLLAATAACRTRLPVDRPNAPTARVVAARSTAAAPSTVLIRGPEGRGRGLDAPRPDRIGVSSDRLRGLVRYRSAGRGRESFLGILTLRVDRCVPGRDH